MRLSTGVQGLDELIGGGYIRDRVYIVCGPPGSGKTTLALQFLLEGALSGERGLFVSMIEVPENIIADFSTYGKGLRNAVQEGVIRFIDFAPETLLERESDEIPAFTSMGRGGTPELESLLSRMEKDYVMLSSDLLRSLLNQVSVHKAKRLVIDSAIAIKFGGGDEKQQVREMIRFIRGLKDIGCTTLLISELIQPDAYAAEHFISHGVIFLHNYLDKGKMRRAIQIVKMKGTGHDTDLHKLSFSKRGLQVGNASGIE
ncbi:MAG TPA: ATPase [Euryarchaeota archaeon]|nr:ATPase [Euryarchaeota archaeon]